MKKGKPKGARKRSMLKSLLSFALIAALAFGNIVPINVAKAEGSSGASNPFNVVQEFMNVDFSEANWSEESGISAVTDETKKIEVVSEEGNESNKCLKVTDLSAGTGVGPSIYLTYSGDTTSKRIVYEYKISFDGENAGSKRTRLTRYASADGWKNHLEQKLGVIVSKIDDTVQTTIQKGKWVCISVVVDYTTSTCDVYVDGTCYVQGGAFLGNQLGINMYKSGQNSYILLDDLRVYEVGASAETSTEDSTEGVTEAPTEGSTEETPEPDTPVPGAPGSDQYAPDLFSLDFNNSWAEFAELIGQTTNVPAATDPVTQVSVPTADNANNKAIMIMRNGSGNRNIQFPKGSAVIDTTGQQIVYEFKLSAMEGKALSTKAKVVAASTTGYVYMNGNGELASSLNGSPVFDTVAPGKWVKIALVADYAAGTYKVYVNDVLQVDSTAFKKNYNFMRITVEEDGHVLVDDVRVYEGTEPHVPGTGVPVGTDVYVDRTFDEIWKYDFEEIDVTKNKSSVEVVKGTDGNKYLKLSGIDAVEPATTTYLTNASSGYIVAYAKLSVESLTGNEGNVFTGVGADGKTFTFLKLKDDALQLPDGTEVAKLVGGTWTEVAVALNAAKQTYTVFVDGQVVAGAADLAVQDIAGAASIYTAVSAGTLLIDDLRVYDARVPKTVWMVDDTPDTIYVKDIEAQALIGEARAIQLNANVLYTDGVKAYASKAFDTSDAGKVYLAKADIEALFGVNADFTTASVKNGAYDVIAVAKASGYTFVHVMEGRMILFGKTAIALESGSVNEKEVNKYLQFERPSIDKIKELFNQNVDLSKNNGHPRLLITEDDVTRIQNLYKNGEEYIVRWGNNAIAAAEEALTTPDFTFSYKPGDSMDHVAEALPMIINLGIATFLTDDAEAKAAYVAKAKSVANIICNLKDWNPKSYLDVGELSFILGLAYDWFYDEFTEEERTVIEENLLEKGISIQNKIYYGKVSSDDVYWTWWDNTNNWNTVCNGGTMMGAIAVFDVYPDICAQVISNSLHGVEFMMESYFPEGVWHEGGGYWRYALTYLAYTMNTFEIAFDDDFDVLCSPGLSTTGWYGLKLSGSTGINNFGDVVTGFVDNKSVLWCADAFNDAELLAARLQEMERQGYTGDGRDIIFYNENLLGDTQIELPLDTVLNSMSVISLRERWYDKGATFFGISGSKPKSGHAHMDTGTFVVDMYGQRIICDVGAEDYDNEDYTGAKRYWFYRNRPEGHNVYIINPTDTAEDPGVNYPWAKVTNTPVVSKDRGAFSTIDMTPLHEGDVNSAIRGFMLTDDRRSVLVRDEIDLKAASELYSYLHTGATVEIDPENPNVAILTMTGTKYKVIIDVQGEQIEEYTFNVVSATSRADYGVRDTQMPGICKLEIYVKTKAAGKINITMKVVGYDDPAADAALITTPIAEWSEDMIPDGETSDLPYLDMIYLDGQPIDTFNPVVTGYSKRLGAAAKLPVVTASSEKYDRIEITHPNEFGEEYVVKVYDNEDENLYRVYRLSYTRLPALKPVDGRERYSVKNITASATPEEAIGNTRESAIDNDFAVSRWTAKCEREGDSHWLMLELDEASMVHKIGFAFFKGNGRATDFMVEVSMDGETWTEVVPRTWSCGTTAGLEYFYDSEEGVLAKYVRYTGWGNSKNAWNNMAEFVVLGPKNSAEEIYELGSNAAVDILHNGTVADLAGVKLDGVAVDAADMTTVDASVKGEIGKVTLSATLMESLTVGDHKLVLEYSDGNSIEVTIVIAEPVAVEIIEEGTATEYENGSNAAVTIHTTGLVAKFIGVKLDGMLVDHDKYEVTEGSTIITFKNEYLDTLAVGEHEVVVLYSGNRSVETTMTIAAVDAETGDLSQAGAWMWMMAFAMMAVATTSVAGFKRKKEK